LDKLALSRKALIQNIRKNMMKLKKLSTIALIVGSLLIAASLLWWYLFYGAAVEQMENATYWDIAACLYSYSGECQIVSRSIALLAGAAPYNPAVFLAGVVVVIVSIVLKALRRKKTT
jgi:hypothetical protein